MSNIKWLNKMKKKNEPPKPPREEGEIKKDYFAACAKLGEIDYQVDVLKGERGGVLENLRIINNEMFDLRELQKSEVKEELPSE